MLAWWGRCRSAARRPLRSRRRRRRRPQTIPQAAPPTAALQLGTPGGVAAPQQDRGGLNLFGYTVLPKLNFGLDVLYGQDQQQLQLGPTDTLGTLEENGDVTVLGKVKRRF